MYKSLAKDLVVMLKLVGIFGLRLQLAIIVNPYYGLFMDKSTFNETFSPGDPNPNR